ncbi:hypothetical protein Tco_0719180 [Tanacetum coccineum]
MGDANAIRTLGDYSKPSHEGYMNTMELPVGNNMVPLRSDTIQLVQNRCSFHGLRSKDPVTTRIIMMNEIPPNHVDDVPVVEPNQHDDVPVVPDPILVDEDEDPKEEEFKEEEYP